VLSAVTISLLVCVVKLFIWYVAVCCLCVCVPDVLVQVYQARTHINKIQPHTKKQLEDVNKQRSSNNTKHGKWPPEDGETIVNETCRVLMICFTNIFNNLVF
jgi:hypothetical protein